MRNVSGASIRCHIPTIMNLCLPHIHNYEDTNYAVVRVIVGIIGDLFTVLSSDMDQYSDLVVPCLMSILARDVTDIGVKCDIVFTLSDYILNNSDYQYIDDILKILLETRTLECLEVAAASLELFSSILQNSMSDSVKSVLRYNSDKLITIALQTAAHFAENVNNCIGLLGDLATHLPQVFTNVGPDQVETIKKLIMTGRHSDDRRTKSLATWAGQQLMNVYSRNVEHDHDTIKKAKVGEEVFYSVKITVSNNQYITQNIETENVTIRLKSNNNNTVSHSEPQVIQCNNVEATVRLPCPVNNNNNSDNSTPEHCDMSDDNDVSISQLRRLRKKRSAMFLDSDQNEKRSKDY